MLAPIDHERAPEIRESFFCLFVFKRPYTHRLNFQSNQGFSLEVGTNPQARKTFLMKRLAVREVRTEPRVVLLVLAFFFVAVNLHFSRKAIQPHLREQVDSSEKSRKGSDAATLLHQARDAVLKVPDSDITTTEKPYEVCFITCLFGNSSNEMDRPQNVTGMQARNPSFRFYAYTNLPDLDAPGWTLLVRQYPYRRFITQSRWGKFMSWRDEIIIQNCRAVIYLDGVVVMKEGAKAAKIFRDIALSVRRSEFGLAQKPHRGGGGILQEFVRIRREKKDIKSNIEKSIEWLFAQPGFERKVTIYENTYFGT